jgi:manganese/zinc/iron transport system permease protein
MVAPAATAYLLTDRLPVMLLLTGLTGVFAAAGGYALAKWLDASIAGMMAAVCGAAFVFALLLAPQRGLVAQWVNRRHQRWEFAGQLLAVHLLNHRGTPAEAAECTFPHCREHMRWPEEFARGVVARAVRHGLVSRSGEALHLTQHGAEVALEVMQRT